MTIVKFPSVYYGREWESEKSRCKLHHTLFFRLLVLKQEIRGLLILEMAKVIHGILHVSLIWLSRDSVGSRTKRDDHTARKSWERAKSQYTIRSWPATLTHVRRSNITARLLLLLLRLVKE